MLEQSATTECESAAALSELLGNPGDAPMMASFAATRARETELASQISEGLVDTFVTGLDREDIEALNSALYKIPRPSRNLWNASKSSTRDWTEWILPSARWCGSDQAKRLRK